MSQSVTVLCALSAWVVVILVVLHKEKQNLIHQNLIRNLSYWWEVPPLWKRLIIATVKSLVIIFLLWTGGFVGKFLMSPIFFLVQQLSQGFPS